MKSYNDKLAKHLLNNQYQEIHKEKIVTGGGSYRGQNPLPINSVFQPSFESPSSNLNTKGGKMKIPKILKDIGHETAHIAAPILKRGAQKLGNMLMDKGIDYAMNSLSSGEGIKQRRGRKSKHQEHHEHHEHAGKFNFINTMKKIGHEVSPYAKEALHSAVKYAPQAAMMAAMAAGIKKRKPNGRNLLIKEIMKKYKCTLPEASKHIKHHNLKY
jgi:hypothetical protein